MSAPARAYFCKNGHLVESYGHGEMGEYENHNICHLCGCEEIACQFEWGDDDYPQFVSTKPETTTNVYFVKGLFASQDMEYKSDDRGPVEE